MALSLTAAEAIEAWKIIEASLFGDVERLDRYKAKYHEFGNTAAFYQWAMVGSTADKLCKRFNVPHTESDLKALWAAIHVHHENPAVHEITARIKTTLSS